MPGTTSSDSSAPRRNGAPVKERVTAVSHVADHPASPRAKGRAVLPSHSPSSTYYSGEKRRQNKSPSPERTEQQKNDLKKRKLNRQSCSNCHAEKQRCLPSERQWPGTKCDICTEKGLPCSQPQSKSSKQDGTKERSRGASDRQGTPSDDVGLDGDSSETLLHVASVDRLAGAQKRYPTPSTSGNSQETLGKSDLLTHPSSASLVSQPAGKSSMKSNPDVLPLVRQDSFHSSFLRPPAADGINRAELVCPECHKPVKTQSELKKHDLRHRKPFVCQFPGCVRTEGFSTTNDLDRHMRSKHQSGALATTPAKLYRCLVAGCKSSEKVWPRGDNFRSHLKRVHGHIIPSDEEFEKLVHKGEFSRDPATFPVINSALQKENPESQPDKVYFPDAKKKENVPTFKTVQTSIQPAVGPKTNKSGNPHHMTIHKNVKSNNAHVPKRPQPTGVKPVLLDAESSNRSISFPQTVERIIARSGYEYKPLLQEETRILVLLPGERDEAIQCRLLSLSVQAPAVSYEALSYNWGNTRASKEIRIHCIKRQGPKRSLRDFVRAKRFIPANLHSALLHLRDSSHPINLWVDNLCINMNDSRERAHQVSKMAQIYRKATNVCVWLGESDESSRLALTFIPRILNLSTLDNELEDASKLDSWKALRDLMSRKWFSRRWIIQEIAFARSSTIHCGDDVVHWADFACAVGLFISRMDKIKQFRGQDSSDRCSAIGWPNFANRIVEFSQSLIQGAENDGKFEPTFDLETLLWSFRDFDCTDPRDRVYSLLALARDVPPLEYDNVDFDSAISSLEYEADITDILQRCVMHCVNLSKSLDIICRPWAPTVSRPLPSWIGTIASSAFGVLDDGSFGRKNGDSFVGSPSRKTYNASAGRTLQDYQFSEDLQLVGLKVDIIGACLPRAIGGIIWREALHMAGWDQSKKLDSAPEKLWRTLVADRSPDGSPPKSWYQLACLYSLAQTSSTGVLDTSTLIRSGGPSIMVEFLERVQSVVWNRKFFTSRGRNLFGLGPDGLQSGDVVAVLYGCSVPVILRPVENRMHYYKLVGECYIHGLMDGQAVTDPDLRDELFHLI